MDISGKVEDQPHFAGFGCFNLNFVNYTASKTPFNPRLLRFEWHERDCWVIGNSVWRNVIGLPRVLIRPIHGRKVYGAVSVLRNWDSPKPLMQIFPIDPARPRVKGGWIFLGFSEHAIVNIDAVQAESAFLKELEDRRWDICFPPDCKLPRPPSGLLV